MPEKEFELYLSLLGKLLRLSPQQKTSIEAELRDHFEERFEALVRSGVPRDEAIRRTLDEFGDVAGLAHEFTHLSRKHIRRRIMQGTAATVGVAAAVVIWATLFRGPEPAIGPAPTLVAQDDPAADKSNPPAIDQSQGALIAAEKARIAAKDGEVEYIDPGQFLPEKLRQEINVEFTGTPLRDVISYISEVAQLPILFDIPALNEQGITGDEEVSLIVRKLPVHAALNVLLQNVNAVELAWMQNAELIQITTKDVADSTKTTQYYNVRDLLKNGYTHEQLISVVVEMTEGPWENIHGQGGTMAEFGDLLVVKQCGRTQTDVACTLAGLRSKAPVRLVGKLPGEARFQAALHSPTSIEFTGTPLRDVISYVAELHDIPIHLDVPALAEQGISGDEEVSLVVQGIKLRNALRLLLANVNQVQLDIVIENGLMWVTTKEEADNTHQTVFYDVKQITADDSLQMDKLEEIIESQTEGPWESLAGTGGVLQGPSPNLLACRQTSQAQDEVASVLEAILDALEASGGDRSSITQYATRLETRFYRMDAEAAADVARLIPALIEPGTWKNIMVSPPEQAELEIGTIYQLNAGRVLMQLESGAVVESVDKHSQSGENFVNPAPVNLAPAPDKPAAAGNSDAVVIPQSVLIITHRPAVLRQISKLLQALLKGDGWTWEGGKDHEKVKFIAPGYQEGTWKGTLGSGAVAPVFQGGAGGMMGGGFGGGGGFFSIQSPNDL